MQTTLFLLRHGETEWARARRVLGRRDLGLNDTGRAQASLAAERLSRMEIAEILSSPLSRAFDFAERIASTHGIQVGRDPRLTDVDVGRWEGKRFEEVQADAEYRAFLLAPRPAPNSTALPGAEPLAAVRDRVVASVEQAMEDNELGANIVVVTHATIVRVLLAHYLGMELANYHRLRVGMGSLSVLRYDSDRGLPRVLTINHGSSLDEIIE